MKFLARLFCAAAVATASISLALATEARVVSVQNTLSYSFIEISRDGKSLWLASDLMALLKPGDRISFDEGYLMQNFYSNDLERAFPNLTFIENVKVIGAE